MKNKLLFLLVILMAFPILLLAAVQEKFLPVILIFLQTVRKKLK